MISAKDLGLTGIEHEYVRETRLKSSI